MRVTDYLIPCPKLYYLSKINQKNYHKLIRLLLPDITRVLGFKYTTKRWGHRQATKQGVTGMLLGHINMAPHGPYGLSVKENSFKHDLYQVRS